jgi:hypothetical protein
MGAIMSSAATDSADGRLCRSARSERQQLGRGALDALDSSGHSGRYAAQLDEFDDLAGRGTTRRDSSGDRRNRDPL